MKKYSIREVIAEIKKGDLFLSVEDGHFVNTISIDENDNLIFDSRDLSSLSTYFYVNNSQEFLKVSSLNDMMNINSIKDNLVWFLSNSLTITNADVEDIYEAKSKIKITKGIFGSDDAPVEWENSLYYSRENDEYLIESRLFDYIGSMINSVLIIVDGNGNLKTEEVDDVWSYTEWFQVV